MSEFTPGARVHAIGELTEAIGSTTLGVVIEVDADMRAEGQGPVHVDWIGFGSLWVSASFLRLAPGFTPPSGYEEFAPGSEAFIAATEGGGVVEFITYGRTDEPITQTWARVLTIPMHQNDDGVWIPDGEA